MLQSAQAQRQQIDNNNTISLKQEAINTQKQVVYIVYEVGQD